MYLHRCRFVEWQPSPITSLAFSPKSEDPENTETYALWTVLQRGRLLAVSRENGNIEIWNRDSGWHMERVSEKNRK